MPLTPKQQPPYYEKVDTTKIYQALLTQTGTNPPVATIQKNTLGEIIWTRTAPGVYFATLAGAFKTDKTLILWGNGGGDPEMNMNYFLNSEDAIELGIYLAGSESDECLTKASIQIIVNT